MLYSCENRLAVGLMVWKQYKYMIPHDTPKPSLSSLRDGSSAPYFTSFVLSPQFTTNPLILTDERIPYIRIDC